MQITKGDKHGVVTWLSLTEEPLSLTNRSLITIASRLQNQNMQWDGTTTVHNQWGNAPTSVQPLNLELSLAIDADSIEVFPLDPMGAPKDSFIVAPQSNGKFILSVDQSELQSLWFGIRSYQNLVSSNTTEFKHLQIYPNPAQSRVSLSGDFTDCNITIFNALGQKMQKYDRANSPIDLDLSDLNPGLYFVSVRSNAQAKLSLKTIVKL